MRSPARIAASLALATGLVAGGVIGASAASAAPLAPPPHAGARCEAVLTVSKLCWELADGVSASLNVNLKNSGNVEAQVLVGSRSITIPVHQHRTVELSPGERISIAKLVLNPGANTQIVDVTSIW